MWRETTPNANQLSLIGLKLFSFGQSVNHRYALKKEKKEEDQQNRVGRAFPYRKSSVMNFDLYMCAQWRQALKKDNRLWKKRQNQIFGQTSSVGAFIVHCIYKAKRLWKAFCNQFWMDVCVCAKRTLWNVFYYSKVNCTSQNMAKQFVFFILDTLQILHS